MYALAPVRLVCVILLGFLNHICKHSRTATEVVGVDAEEQSSAREDGVAGNHVKFWVFGYGVTFVWRRDVGIDEWCIPRPFGQCWRTG